MFAQMKRRKKRFRLADQLESPIDGYRDNAFEVDVPSPQKRMGLTSRIALRFAAAEWGPWKRLGQLVLVAAPYLWPVVLVPWFGWGVGLSTSIIIFAVWLVPGMVICLLPSVMDDKKIGAIGVVLRFSWWPVYGFARLYRWVRDGQ